MAQPSNTNLSKDSKPRAHLSLIILWNWQLLICAQCHFTLSKCPLKIRLSEVPDVQIKHLIYLAWSSWLAGSVLHCQAGREGVLNVKQQSPKISERQQQEPSRRSEVTSLSEVRKMRTVPAWNCLNLCNFQGAFVSPDQGFSCKIYHPISRSTTRLLDLLLFAPVMCLRKRAARTFQTSFALRWSYQILKGKLKQVNFPGWQLHHQDVAPNQTEHTAREEGNRHMTDD